MQEALTQCFGTNFFFSPIFKVLLLSSFKFLMVTCKVGIALSIWTLQAGRFFFLWISAVVVLLSCFPESQWFMFWIGFINLRHAPLKKHFLQTPIHKICSISFSTLTFHIWSNSNHSSGPKNLACSCTKILTYWWLWCTKYSWKVISQY